MWTWDITYLRSSKYTGRFYYAYVIVDVYSRMVVSARVFEADNADLSARTVLHSCIKGFLRAKKLWVNPPKAERAKPSLSSDYNLLFKNKIGERSLDIHRNRTPGRTQTVLESQAFNACLCHGAFCKTIPARQTIRMSNRQP